MSLPENIEKQTRIIWQLLNERNAAKEEWQRAIKQKEMAMTLETAAFNRINDIEKKLKAAHIEMDTIMSKHKEST